MRNMTSTQADLAQTPAVITLGVATAETRGLSQGIEPDVGETYFEESRINQD